MPDSDPTPSRWARRRAKRRAAADRVEQLAGALTAWREDRRAAAAKAHREARAADLEARAGKRGVDRVPARLRETSAPVPGLHEQSPVRSNGDGTVRRGGNRILTEDRPAGNYATRRARGQRGHRRRPRRREITAMGAALRAPDSTLALERGATRAARDQLRGRA